MVQTTIRFPDKLYQRLKEEARTKGLTVNALVIGILWEKMDYLFATEGE